jgi:hypothetical protein
MNDKPPDSESKPNPLALGVAITAGILAALLRIVPHPPNFSAVGGLGIFGGARLRGWQAFAFPLGIMILSDLALWLITGLDPKYSLAHPSRFFVYGSFMIYVLIGRWLGESKSLLTIAGAGALGAFSFFLITNFCEWLFQPFMDVPAMYLYSRDMQGLAACYIAGLGFSQNDPAISHPFMLFTDFRTSMLWAVLGDVFFATVYLLSYAKLAQRVEAVPQPAVMSEAQS